MATELAILALDSTGWTPERALEVGGDPQQAILALKAREVPLKDAEPEGGKRTAELKSALGLIGAKIAPTMSVEQSAAWAAAMVMALSDLPAAFALRGARDALHVPIRFMNEVEGAVREKADAARERHLTALHRLRRFKRDIESAGKPKLAAPEVPPITQDGINAMPLELRRMGLRLGHITQEQFDIAAAKDETNAE